MDNADQAFTIQVLTPPPVGGGLEDAVAKLNVLDTTIQKVTETVKESVDESERYEKALKAVADAKAETENSAALEQLKAEVNARKSAAEELERYQKTLEQMADVEEKRLTISENESQGFGEVEKTKAHREAIEELNEAFQGGTNDLKLFNFQGSEFRKLVHEANQIVPGLGLALKGIFHPEVLGLGLAVVGLKMAIDVFKENKIAAEEFTKSASQGFAGLTEIIRLTNQEADKLKGAEAIDKITQAQKRFEDQTSINIAAIHRQEAALLALTNATAARDLAQVDLDEASSSDPGKAQKADARRDKIRSSVAADELRIKDDATKKELAQKEAAYDALLKRIGELEKTLAENASPEGASRTRGGIQNDIAQAEKSLGPADERRNRKEALDLQREKEKGNLWKDIVDYEPVIGKSHTQKLKEAEAAFQEFEKMEALLKKSQARLGELDQIEQGKEALKRLKEQEAADRAAFNAAANAAKEDMANRGAVAGLGEDTRGIQNQTKNTKDESERMGTLQALHRTLDNLRGQDKFNPAQHNAELLQVLTKIADVISTLNPVDRKQFEAEAARVRKELDGLRTRTAGKGL